jgi:hypothetical protein
MSRTEWSDCVVSELPTGTVTLLLADVEGSTRLWESQPEDMTAAIARLDTTLADVITAHRGVRPVEQGEGDSFVLASSADPRAAGNPCAQALGNPHRRRAQHLQPAVVPPRPYGTRQRSALTMPTPQRNSHNQSLTTRASRSARGVFCAYRPADLVSEPGLSMLRSGRPGVLHLSDLWARGPYLWRAPHRFRDLG